MMKKAMVPAASSRDGANVHDLLLGRIRAFCERHGIAETTFGRLTANDGKLVGRIAGGLGLKPATIERIHTFIADVDAGRVHIKGRPRRKRDVSNREAMTGLVSQETGFRTAGSFAFHEQRQRNLIFGSTTNEAWVLADRIAAELRDRPFQLPGARLFISPMDSGMTANRILRAFHRAHPNVPVLVVLRGRGLEELSNAIGRLVDRLTEHPLTVFAMTNMYVREAVELRKISRDCPHDLVWREAPLRGRVSQDFQEEITPLYSDLAREWLVDQGRQGQPVYHRPSVLVLYREDHRLLLEPLIPRRSSDVGLFDYCLLNRPYLHSHTMNFRIDHVLEPVVARLAPGGTLSVIQPAGADPAHDIIRRVWPNAEAPFVSRYETIKALRHRLGREGRDYAFRGLTDAGSLFRFDMHTLPVLEDRPLGVMSLATAWNNAVYFGQVREELIQSALKDGFGYLEETRRVLEERAGLWFLNEQFSIERRNT